ncbi:MAG: hypothetical protein WKG06_24720 [Segetibacter sp.]
MLLRKDKEAFGLLYDIYAAAIYGIICKEINNEEKAKEILTNVFIHFNKELKNKDSIREGLFVCLYRITNEMICNCKI